MLVMIIVVYANRAWMYVFHVVALQDGYLDTMQQHLFLCQWDCIRPYCLCINRRLFYSDILHALDSFHVIMCMPFVHG